MIYYLVALLDPESYKKVELIQRDICTKYNLFSPFEKLPILHITLETIDEPDLPLLDKSIRELLKNYSSFETICHGVICFEPPHKSVNLSILQGGVIENLSHDLNSTLKEKGFKVRQSILNYKLHISLANSNFSKNSWTDLEYEDACTFAQNSSCNIKVKISELQLWKPLKDEKDMIVYSYSLGQLEKPIS